MAKLEIAGQEIEIPEQVAAKTRFDEACMAAVAEQNIRFTIPEMDQLLAAE